MALVIRSSRLGPSGLRASAAGAVTVRGAALVGLSMALAMRDSRLGAAGGAAGVVLAGASGAMVAGAEAVTGGGG